MEHFSAERFTVLKRIAPDHFWFAGRRELVDNILARVLDGVAEVAVDLGCGAGEDLHLWKGHARRVIGIDQHAERIDLRCLADSVTVVAADVLALPLRDESADLILALDVLEHVPDSRALREAERVLKPGGVILVAVPAFRWLWSYRDVDAGHLRRYSKGQIRRLLESAELRVELLRFYQFLLFPLVVISRFLGRRTHRIRDFEDTPPGPLNRLLAAVQLFEVRIGARGLRMPFGSSILVAARKPLRTSDALA